MPQGLHHKQKNDISPHHTCLYSPLYSKSLYNLTIKYTYPNSWMPSCHTLYAQVCIFSLFLEYFFLFRVCVFMIYLSFRCLSCNTHSFISDVELLLVRLFSYVYLFIISLDDPYYIACLHYYCG